MPGVKGCLNAIKQCVVYIKKAYIIKGTGTNLAWLYNLSFKMNNWC